MCVTSHRYKEMSVSEQFYKNIDGTMKILNSETFVILLVNCSNIRSVIKLSSMSQRSIKRCMKQYKPMLKQILTSNSFQYSVNHSSIGPYRVAQCIE